MKKTKKKRLFLISMILFIGIIYVFCDIIFMKKWTSKNETYLNSVFNYTVSKYRENAKENADSPSETEEVSGAGKTSGQVSSDRQETLTQDDKETGAEEKQQEKDAADEKSEREVKSDYGELERLMQDIAEKTRTR